MKLNYFDLFQLCEIIDFAEENKGLLEIQEKLIFMMENDFKEKSKKLETMMESGEYSWEEVEQEMKKDVDALN